MAKLAATYQSVLWTIHEFTRYGNEFFGSNEHIAEFTDIKLKTVQNILSDLKRKGFISTTGRGRNRTIRINYEVLCPQLAKEKSVNLYEKAFEKKMEEGLEKPKQRQKIKQKTQNPTLREINPTGQDNNPQPVDNFIKSVDNYLKSVDKYVDNPVDNFSENPTQTETKSYPQGKQAVYTKYINAKSNTKLFKSESLATLDTRTTTTSGYSQNNNFAQWERRDRGANLEVSRHYDDYTGKGFNTKREITQKSKDSLKAILSMIK